MTASNDFGSDLGDDLGLDGILSEIRPQGALDSISPIDGGNRKRTVVVEFVDSEPVVVQRTAEPATARVSAALIEAIESRTSVPVARPLGSGTDSGGGWLATSLVEGSDLHELFADLSADSQQGFAARFGQHLADLHESFAFDGCGQVGVRNGRLGVVRSQQEAADWRAWFVEFAETAIDRLPSEFDDLRSRLLETVGTASREAQTPRLFPWDLRPGNALGTADQLRGIVDWERPLAAAPAVSVAKTEYLVADWYVSADTAPILREAFREGYESVRRLPAVEPADRIAAIADTAVDSRGTVTNPRYPPLDRSAAVAFHRRSLDRVL